MSNPEFHLIHAQKHHVGAFRLKDAWLHPRAHDTAVVLPAGSGASGDGTILSVPIPYGSLEAYAQHLAAEWGSDEAYVIIHISLGTCTRPPTADDLSRANEAALNALPPEQRQRLKPLDTYRREDFILEEDLPAETKSILMQLPLEDRRRLRFMKNSDGSITVVRS
jgi:hypothetical protein